MGISLGNPVQIPIPTASVPVGFGDADAVAFLQSGSLTNPVTVNAIYRLVYDLKSASLWDKIYAAYPFASNQGDITPNTVYSDYYFGTCYHLNTDYKIGGYAPPPYTPGGVLIQTVTSSEVVNTAVDRRITTTTFGVSASNTYTLAIDAKATLETPRIKLAFVSSSAPPWSSTNPSAIFDLSTGQVVATSSIKVTGSMTYLDNGWYTCKLTTDTTSSFNYGDYGTQASIILISGSSQTQTFSASISPIALLSNLRVVNGRTVPPSSLSTGPATVQAMSLNLKDPRPLTSSNYLSFTGSYFFSGYGVYFGKMDNVGYTSMTGFANTYFSFAQRLTTSSYHFGWYERRTVGVGDTRQGTYDPVTGRRLTWQLDGNNYDSQVGLGLTYISTGPNNGTFVVGNTKKTGPWLMTTTNSTSSLYYSKFTASQSLQQTASVNHADVYFTLGQESRAIAPEIVVYATNARSAISFMTFGEGLTVTESAAYMNIVERFQQNMSRSVDY